jgi:hemolysin III
MNQPGAVAVGVNADVRPLMRGTLHLVMAALAPFGLVLLLVIAETPRAYVSASIFAATLVALYSTSASYHMVPWRASWRRTIHRVDHAMIFALIAGTYTPFCLIVLSQGWGVTMLSLVWTFAGIGVLLKVLWMNPPRWLSVGLYLGIGWLALIPAAEVATSMHPAAIATLLVGGLFYTAGAVVYALRRPNPYPRVFGFHEVFHALVIAGSLVHFVLIAVYVLPS